MMSSVKSCRFYASLMLPGPGTWVSHILGLSGLYNLNLRWLPRIIIAGTIASNDIPAATWKKLWNNDSPAEFKLFLYSINRAPTDALDSPGMGIGKSNPAVKA